MKRNAKRALSTYLKSNNKSNLIQTAVPYLDTFIDNLIKNNAIQNRELALTYIAELKAAGVDQTTVQFLINKALTLFNTPNLELDLVEQINTLDFTLTTDIYGFSFEINNLMWVNNKISQYQNNLRARHLPPLIVKALTHYLKIFLLAIYVTGYTRVINKSFAQKYILELEPYIDASLKSGLMQKIERFSDSVVPESFLKISVTWVTGVNVIVRNEPEIPLIPEQERVLRRLLVKYPDNKELETEFNRSIVHYYKNINEYLWNQPETAYSFVITFTKFINTMIAGRGINVTNGNMYIQLLKKYSTETTNIFMIDYVNGDSNPNPDIEYPSLESIKSVATYHKLIMDLENIKKRHLVKNITPLKYARSPELKVREASLVMPVDSKITGEYMDYVKKLNKFTSTYGRKCTDLDELKKYVRRNARRYTLKYEAGATAVIHDVNPEYCLAGAFKYWSGVSRAEQVRFSFRNVEDYTNFEIKYVNSAGIGVGVTRDFFTNCCKELVKYGVFVKGSEGEAGVDRYIVNERFIPDETFRKEADMDFNEIGDFALFFEFVGRLLGLSVVNDIGLEFGLSFGVLYGMLTGKEVKAGSVELVGCYMMDRPVEATSLINLFKTPELIESVGLEYDKQITLPGPLNNPSQIMKVPKTVEVNSENYIEYLETRAFETLGKSINALVEGFRPMNKLLKTNKNINLFILDKLISFEPLTMETVGKLIQNVEQNSLESEAKESILKILRREVRGSKKSEGKFLEWVRGLLAFWASYENYIPSLKYNVVVVEGEGRYPESHTCFARIDIPRGYAGDAGKVYKKLTEAIAGMETGIGKYGGGK